LIAAPILKLCAKVFILNPLILGTMFPFRALAAGRAHSVSGPITR
jgi:hypothetical protein